MTWIVKPQENCLPKPNRAFWTVIEKLNLSDGSGKIRDDIDFVERLENMPKSELKDWEELDNVSDYLLYRVEIKSYGEDPFEERKEAFKQKYGKKSEELFTFYIYGDEIRLNDESISTPENNFYY